MTITTRLILAFLFVFACGCSADTSAPVPQRLISPPPHFPSTQPATRPAPYILHLPGIGGPLPIDRALAAGLSLAHLPKIDIYDWTCNDAGLHALVAYERNRQQGDIVAKKLVDFRRAHPDTPIYITSHSGGTGIAVWALEKLPADVKIDTLFLMCSALSPTYDLSPALAHVKGHCYVLYSEHDNLVLGMGTKNLGTIDRVNTEAAGMVGFKTPDDPKVPNQYAKIVAMPYDPAWMRYGNLGDHIGPMTRAFAAYILAPLLGGVPPALPTSRPALAS